MKVAVRTGQVYRDACRRSHQILAVYLALWAWKKRVDCVVIHRNQLHPYLGIKARRQQRFRWLVADTRHLFPYRQELYQRRSGGRGTLYLSRKKFPPDIFDKSMYDIDRIGLLGEHGHSAAMIEKLPSERAMAQFLASPVIGNASNRA